MKRANSESGLKAADAMDEVLLEALEERAENLSQQNLQKWSIATARDKAVIKKLKGPGAKLLKGPRGSGKSTLLLTAYYEMLGEKKVIPIYTNYSKSLALEPLFHRHANAVQLFRQWLVMKIIQGAAGSFLSWDMAVPAQFAQWAVYAESFVRALEVGSAPESLSQMMAPSELVTLLENLCDYCSVIRCVILLDDAAHAFSAEQQREFFEIFREIRSRRVSCKAAVYPGITAYSPNFHVGHEAEEIESWHDPFSQEYIQSMLSSIKRRFPDAASRELLAQEDLLTLLCLCSFGLPRGFLNMISRLIREDERERSYFLLTRKNVLNAIGEEASNIRSIFLSLSDKLPRFKNFVGVGRELEVKLSALIRIYNSDRAVTRKAVIVALREPVNSKIDRILRLLEYAGVVRKEESVARGVKGSFSRYTMHSAIVVNERSLALGKSFAIETLVKALATRDAHSFVRTQVASLFDGSYIERNCVLELPPCEKCKEARISEDQKFCIKCGAELASTSTYEELLKAPIEKLGLPKKKVEGILRDTGLKTVQDILTDDEQALLRVNGIGKIWSKKIKDYAEEFVSV